MRVTLLSCLCLIAAAIPAAGQNAPAAQPLHDRLLVKLVHEYPAPADAWSDDLESTGDASLDALLRAEGVSEVRRIFRRPGRGWADEAAAADIGLERWIRVHFDGDRVDLDLVRESIAAHGAVETCGRESLGHVADTVPNDPDFNLQYSLQNGKLNAPKAWDYLTDSDYVVAVLDTGLELSHDDLKGNIWINTDEIKNNGIDDDNNGFIDDRKGWDFYYNDKTPDDRFGHGVHCAGTVGAVTDNSRQVAGVCWNVEVMAVKIFSDSGGGTHSICAAGMVYAADNGAKVFSMSWGFPDDSAGILNDAVKYAAALDVTQVAAAHNWGGTDRAYPAALGKVIGVIATDANDNKTSWSNYGSWCDIAAPGDNILSTYLNNSTAYLSGTSMSTPHVAGAAALIRQANPTMDAVDARWVLNYSANDLGSSGFDIHFGWGRLDLLAAVEMAMRLRSSTPTAVPGDSVTFTLEQPGANGFVHVLLASREGRRPGLPMTGFDPLDFRQMALNYDAALIPFILTHPGTGAGVFDRFFDQFDAAGLDTATFRIPGGPLFAGEKVDFAFLSFDPADLTRISEISNSVRLDIQ